MGRVLHRDITIRGVTYRTAAEAARALGVGPHAIRLAARRGTLDFCGLGKRNVPEPTMISGRLFESQRAAAKFHRCSAAAVSKAITDGDPDRIARPKRRNGSYRVAVCYGGLRFGSIVEAARALEVSPRLLYNERHTGSPVQREQIMAAAMRYLAAQERKHQKRAA